MEKLITLEEAITLIIEHTVTASRMEEVSLQKALWRIAAEDYRAVTDQPPFDRSPLDGYALRSEDIVMATREHPCELTVIETVYAGDVPTKTVLSGQAVRIMTGAMLPKGADCVIRQEDTVEITQGDVKAGCQIFTPLKAHQNICRQGEDIRKGSVIIQKGTVIKPVHGAVLAGQGIFRINVYARVRAAILTTGSELVSDSDDHSARDMQGKIFNSNGVMLAMRLEELGIEADIYSISDDLLLIQQKIEELADHYDAIITTGGVSVGEKDYIPEVMKRLGAQVLFHGVDVKPGTPVLSAKYHDRMLYCLSGNPFAAMATLELLAVPGLLKRSGLYRIKHQRFSARLLNDFPKDSIKKRRFIRAQRQEKGIYIPDNHSSGSLYSMIGCNCMIDIPSGWCRLKKGETVQAVELFDLHSSYTEIGQNLKEEAVRVLCICGCKNSGKTTLLEGILPYLQSYGMRINVVKHDGHDFKPDVPGTDSARIHAAGSFATVIYSNLRQAYYIEQNLEQDSCPYEEVIDRLLSLQVCLPDLILIEGLKNSKYDKIEIIRSAVSEKSVVHNGSLLAVCTDLEHAVADRSIKQFGLNDYEQIAEFIIQYLENHIS